MADSYNSIFDYITAQETAYKKPIPINDSWDWSMYDHIKLSTLYKNSQLKSGRSDFKPVKNITRPILNLQYRAEGFDVKDIILFVDDSKQYFKSFLVKKFHEKWARENAIDTTIDEMVESYVDYGGALLKNVNDVKPEVVPLQSIVFCDQTDLLSGPIGIKHFYSPDQLLDMASRGWGDTGKGATATLEETILLSREEKRDDKNTQSVKTPGRYIEVYEVHGNFPKRFLDEYDTSGLFSSQLHIVCFYQKKDSYDKGLITLYKSEEKKSPFKLVKRDPVYGRALGFGGAEELFEPQVWVNYDMIRMQDMLDAASKTILKTTDPAVANRNKIRDMDNLEIIELQANTDLNQIDTFPRNLALFEKSTKEWEAHAQQMGAANDSIMGEPPTAGTPFKLQELVTQESHSLHEYRKGKLATFWDEVEMDWIVPYLSREISKEQEFLAELDLDELQYVAESLVQCETERMKKEYVLEHGGDALSQEQVDLYKQEVLDQFKKKGNKHFIQILKGEMKDAPISVRTTIAGKQKDLARYVDKLTNLFRTIMQNPAILQNKAMAGLFNQIIESSGLDPVDFTDFEIPAPQPAQPSPLQPALAPKQPANAY
jgi:hypothetical protein